MSVPSSPRRCRLAAMVSSPDEARRALEAGADYVLAPAKRERATIGVPERMQAAADTQLLFAVGADEALPAEPRRVARVGTPVDPQALLRDGFSALLLDPGRPLLRALTLETVAAQVEACRAAGLECWLGGALELPDIPRLLVLQPDALVVEGLGPDALLAALGMLASTEPVGSGPTDTIRVTNFVLQARVGAYGFERDRTQRVRFCVEAAVQRPVRTARQVGEVYSYDVIMDAARRLCERGHTDLVETLAEDLADEILRDGRVSAVTVRVEKLDLGPEAVGIEIHRRAGGN